jgi:hypothetical protein
MPAFDRKLATILTADVDYSWLHDIIAAIHGGAPSNWAILCVCFNDDPVTLPALDHHRKLFTNEGVGTMNMVQFFSDMSHGRIDVGDSKVFGWYRLDRPRGDYVGNVDPEPAGKLNRNGLRNAAWAAATADEVELSKFDGFVVSAFGDTDLCGWVGGMAALCDAGSLQPSLLGQEMGHGYGLDHARLDGSEADYQDPWDVMSTAAWRDHQVPNADYVSIGPGLNAACMRSRGWLDETRVWSGSSVGHDAVVTLRPLHHRHLSGYLAAEVGPYLVELRVREHWDAAIPRAAVLIHRFFDNHSYLMPASTGSGDLVEGDRFESGGGNHFYPYILVQVLNIDEGGRTAKIRIGWRPGQYEIVGQVFGAVTIDGGGGIIVNGKFHPVPPRGPAHQLLGALSNALSSDVTTSVAAGTAYKRELLRQVVKCALQMQAELAEVTHSPPRPDAPQRKNGEH